MKRIFMISMLAFFSSMGMEKAELEKQAETAKSAEGQPEQKLNGVAKREQAQTVETLYACSLRASLALLKESGEKVIDFIEQITVNDCPAYPCAQLIELYIKDLEAKALADPTGPFGAKLNRERIELAAYCVTKSFALYIKSNKTGPIPHPFLVDEQRIEGPKKGATKVCPFAELGLKLLKDLLDDKFFEDQAVVQPLALICMAKSIRSIRVDDQRNIPLNVGYEKLKEFLFPLLHGDRVIHGLRQLIVHDEQAALHLLELIKSRRAALLGECAEHLFCWAELFNRPSIVEWLIEWQKVDDKKRGHGSVPHLDRWYKRHSCSCIKGKEHLRSHFERAVCLGDVKSLEHIKGAEYQRISDLGERYLDPTCSRLMHIAAMLGYKELAQWCLQRGAKVKQKDIQEAADYGQVEVLRLLLAHFEGLINADGYWVDEGGDDVRAVQYGHLEAIKCIISRLDSSAFERLLNNAALNHNKEIVAYLLDNIHRTVSDEKMKAKIIRGQFCDALSNHASKAILDQFTQRSIAINGFSDAADAHTNPLRCAVQAMIDVGPFRFKGEPDPLELTKENIEFLLEHGARDEPDSKGVTTLSYLEESKAYRIEGNEKEYEPYRAMEITYLDAIIKKIAEASVRDVLVREEKYSEGLMHFPKPPSDI